MVERDLRARDHRLARRRGLVVVVSDLLDASDWGRELRALSARHDLVVAHVSDPREDDLPPVGERRDAATRAVRTSGAGYLTVSTERDWPVEIVTFVAARRRRR